MSAIMINSEILTVSCSDETDDESLPLLRKHTVTKIYKRRWYILFIFCMLGLIQNCVWNTFGPIAGPTERVYSLTDGDIALLANWGSIAYLIILPVVCWLLDEKGLRWSISAAAGLSILAAVLRCVSADPVPGKALINVAQFLNGLCGPIVMAAPAVVSSVWFPTHERTTATALGTQILNVGFAISFLLGPYMVPDTSPQNHDHPHGPHRTPRAPHQRSIADPLPLLDASDAILSKETFPIMSKFPLAMAPFVLRNQSSGNHSSAPDVRQERRDVLKLMYIEAGFTAILAFIIFIYFPSKPTKPPSISAASARVDYKVGVIKLLQHKQFWLLSLGYGITSGVFNGWSSLLNVLLYAVQVTEIQAGWIGFTMSIVSSITSVVIARIMDMIDGHRKIVLIIQMIISGLCYAWLLLMMKNILPSSLLYIYLSIVIGNVCTQGCVPLFYELTVEVTYPIAEGITSGGLTLPNNLISIAFLVVAMIPGTGTDWMTYALVASSLGGILCTIFVDERYNRTSVDERKHGVSS